jgi:hypothetical protein
MCKKETLSLTKDEAIKYYNSSNDQGFKDLLESKFGKNFYKPKSMLDKINTLGDLEKELGKRIYDIRPYQQNDFYLSKKQKSINAQVILFELIELYNEGWKPDISNTSQAKYYFYKYFSGGLCSVEVDYDYHYLNCASGLYFKNKEIGEKLKSNFPELIEDYFM